MNAPERIAYIVSLFPVTRETFIARELIELERRGFGVIVASERNDDQQLETTQTPPAPVW